MNAILSLFTFLFLSLDAFADAADAQAAPNPLMQVVPILAVFVIFYFLILRPQQKKQKEHQGMIDGLKSGNKIVTNAGMIGVIKEIDKEKDLITLTISDKVDILIYRKSISHVFEAEKKK